MEVRDLVDEVRRGRISSDEAEDILDRVLASLVEGGTVDLQAAVGSSAFEHQAYLHEASIGRLAAVRGRLATRCVRCTRDIDLLAMPWTIEFRDDSPETAGFGLRHLVCPDGERADL